MKYARHELSARWPDMSREDFDNLEASIKDNGLREPITIFEGEVLDGWHRYQACESVGIDGATVEFAGSYEDARVLIQTRHTRRNLPPGQFAACVLGMYESRTGSGGQNAQKANCTGAVRSTKDLAELAGVSERTIAKVKAAVAIDPEALEKIRTGKTTASKILKDAKPAKTKPAKPAAPAAPANAEAIAALEEQVSVAQKTADELIEDNNSMGRVFDANDQVAASVNEALRYREENRILRERINGLLTEKNEYIKLAKSWQRKCVALEKRLAETVTEF